MRLHCPGSRSRRGAPAPPRHSRRSRVRRRMSSEHALRPGENRLPVAWCAKWSEPETPVRAARRTAGRVPLFLVALLFHSPESVQMSDEKIDAEIARLDSTL